MNNVFKKIDEDKKNRIINSALEEFGNNDFKKASTNNIVKKAGISKGLLYHYFKTKKLLYEHLEIFSLEIIADAIINEIDWEEEDLFIRLKQIIIIKMKVLAKYPGLTSFSKRMMENKPIEELKEQVEKYVPGIYHEVYFKNINFNLFKDDIDKQKSIQIIQWTIEKYGEEWSKKNKNIYIELDKIILEMDEYLLILKKAFYKGGSYD